MTWVQIEYIMAGFGMAAIIGLTPMCAFVYWFAKTYATEKYVLDAISRAITDFRDREGHIRQMIATNAKNIEHLEKSHQESEILTARMETTMRSLEVAVKDLTRFLQRSYQQGPSCPTPMPFMTGDDSE